MKLIFQWSHSERPLVAIGKNITSVVKWALDKDDMVNEIAGIKSINSSVMFIS